MNYSDYIVIKNCRIAGKERDYLPPLSWEYKHGQTWLITGGNKSGKEHFIAALADERLICPIAPNGIFESVFSGQCVRVSLEDAAALIADERRRDESDYIEGGVDIGRTVRAYLGEVLAGDAARRIAEPENSFEIQLTGIGHILERGLKYLSTGEIRRVLLARALLSGKKLMLLSEPFAGLDAASRKTLFDFFDALAAKEPRFLPRIILCADRYEGIPSSVNSVLEFTNGQISFNGTRADYETLLAAREHEPRINERRNEFKSSARELTRERYVQNNENFAPLIDMKNVNVAWSDNHVLKNLSWRVTRGEHWFVRGPNGSGKTTLLELITGDNMQVFSNEVRLFGLRRGSGETLWDIRKKIGVVSYRLHLEYRMVGGTTIEDTVVSGFHDSIGLYEPKTDIEKIAAKKWLCIAGFSECEHAAFSSLSYGEQRAALILRATVKCPPLLILDEPCHGLDERARTMVLDLLETIAREGISTILHVSHDPTEMLPFEKHILELCPTKNPMYKIEIIE